MLSNYLNLIKRLSFCSHKLILFEPRLSIIQSRFTNLILPKNSTQKNTATIIQNRSCRKYWHSHQLGVSLYGFVSPPYWDNLTKGVADGEAKRVLWTVVLSGVDGCPLLVPRRVAGCHRQRQSQQAPAVPDADLLRFDDRHCTTLQVARWGQKGTRVSMLTYPAAAFMDDAAIFYCLIDHCNNYRLLPPVWSFMHPMWPSKKHWMKSSENSRPSNPRISQYYALMYDNSRFSRLLSRTGSPLRFRTQKVTPTAGFRRVLRGFEEGLGTEKCYRMLHYKKGVTL